MNLSSFELKENLIVLTCNINGEHRNFILDSSTPEVILNSKYQKSFYENDSKAAREITTEANAKVKIDSLTFGAAKATNLFANNMDLSHIEQSLDTEVYGLIGYEFLKKYTVFLDYQELKIGFWNEDQRTGYINKKAHRSYRFNMENHLPIISCMIGGSTYHMMLDTGANTNLFDVNLKDQLKDHMIMEKHEQMVGTVPESSNTNYLVGTMKTLEIEGLGEFSQMSTVLAEMSYMNVGTTTKIHGILGYPFLSQGKFIICFTQHKLYIIE